MTATPRQVFDRLVAGVAAFRFDELPDLYAEVTDVRHPMATPPAEPLRSRDELRAHFTVPAGSPPPAFRRRAVDVVVHETSDDEVIVAEFSYEFTHDDGGVALVPCVFVMRVREGVIVESRDYIDPIRSAEARRSLDALADHLRSQAG